MRSLRNYTWLCWAIKSRPAASSGFGLQRAEWLKKKKIIKKRFITAWKNRTARPVHPHRLCPVTCIKKHLRISSKNETTLAYFTTSGFEQMFSTGKVNECIVLLWNGDFLTILQHSIYFLFQHFSPPSTPHDQLLLL